MKEKHIISTMVHNHPGVLLRIAGLFSRRGFNIDSLTVSETQDPEYSRMTIVVAGDEAVVEQVKCQLAKVVDVKQVAHFEEGETSCSELLMIKVRVTPEERAVIYKIAATYHARILDVGQQSMTLEATGHAAELNELIKHLQKQGIMEMARTGITALEKGDHCLSAQGMAKED